MIAKEDLEALEAKYVAMRTLRHLHARARQDASFEEPDPRPAMVALAARFPGALRELDALPLTEIDARIDAIAAAKRAPFAAPSWMEAQIVFHELLRGALFAKRWLRTRSDAGPHLAEAYAAVAAPEALPWREHLDEIQRPPGGRLLALVYRALAARLGVDEAEAIRRTRVA